MLSPTPLTFVRGATPNEERSFVAMLLKMTYSHSLRGVPRRYAPRDDAGASRHPEARSAEGPLLNSERLFYTRATLITQIALLACAARVVRDACVTPAGCCPTMAAGRADGGAADVAVPAVVAGRHAPDRTAVGERNEKRLVVLVRHCVLHDRAQDV